MRIFALSDIHIDYETNAQWIRNLSTADYQNDVLILAGDVTDSLLMLDWCLGTLAQRFRQVLFVPGNHELWVIREGREKNSLEKFDEVCRVVESSGASMQPFRTDGLSIIPLLGWYDYSFGQPGDDLRALWMDYRACRWPDGFTEADVTAHFTARNDGHAGVPGHTVITYSHFLPRIDLMPDYIPSAHRFLYPVLGSLRLDQQLRRLASSLHVYGHSHVNRRVTIDGVDYVNNAFGYPHETRIAAKDLLCIHDSADLG